MESQLGKQKSNGLECQFFQRGNLLINVGERKLLNAGQVRLEEVKMDFGVIDAISMDY